LHNKTQKFPSKMNTPKLLKNPLVLFSLKSSHKLTNTSILTIYTSAYLPFACINRWTNNNKTEIEKKNHWLSLSRMSMYQEFSPIYFFLRNWEDYSLKLFSKNEGKNKFLCDCKPYTNSDREKHCKRSWIKVSLLVVCWLQQFFLFGSFC